MTDAVAIYPISFFVLGTSFILHELGHRNVARHFNYHAEFRKWDFGLKLALGAAALVGAIFAAPGAVYIGAKKQKKSWEEQTRWDKEYPEYKKNGMNELGLISVAGVVINISLGLIFLGLFFTVVPSLTNFQFVATLICYLGYSINFFLAGFNLLPFWILDGKKVMEWNPIVWGILFIPLAYWYFSLRLVMYGWFF